MLELKSGLTEDSFIILIWEVDKDVSSRDFAMD